MRLYIWYQVGRNDPLGTATLVLRWADVDAHMQFVVLPLMVKTKYRATNEEDGSLGERLKVCVCAYWIHSYWCARRAVPSMLLFLSWCKSSDKRSIWPMCIDWFILICDFLNYCLSFLTFFFGQFLIGGERRGACRGVHGWRRAYSLQRVKHRRFPRLDQVASVAHRAGRCKRRLRTAPR